MTRFIQTMLGLVLCSAVALATETSAPKAAPATPKSATAAPKTAETSGQKAVPVAPKEEAAAPKVEPVAPKPEPIVLSVDAARSRVEYKVVHTFHDVVGKSQKARGGVKVLPDGRIMVAVSAPIASFDSENSSRDVKMQEVLDAAKYSDVVFTGTAPFTMPTKFPATQKLNVEGELSFHGRKKKESVPVEVTFASATEAHAVGKFAVSLEKYEVERPSLTFIKIHDDCQIALDLLLKQ